jgi:uncharacterized membrane protein
VPVTFNQPLFLLLTLLIVPAAILGVRWFATMSRARAWSAIIIRAILLALLSAILAGASAVRSRDRVAVIAVIDVSQSVRQLADEFADMGTDAMGKRRRWNDAVRTWLERAAVGRKPDDLMGLVVFDGSAIAAAAPTTGPLTDFSLDWTLAEGTDIGAALRLAEAMFPPGAARRIVLISDGAETAGSAAESAERLAANTAGATRVDAVPLAFRVRNEVMIEAVDTPPLAAALGRVAVRVVLSATDPAEGTLDLRYERTLIDINGDAPGTGMPVSLRPGRNTVIVEVDLAPGMVHRFEPVFTPANAADDRMVSNNAAEAFTVSPGKGQVAIVDGWNLGPRSPLVRTLIANEINAVTITPAELPLDLLKLSQYDCIILDNVPSEDLPRRAHGLLADYVDSLGGGLIMVGGRDSLTAGGWKGTELEAILPVSLDLPDDVIMPSGAVVFIIDASGSMAGAVQGGNKTQQHIANEATALAIATLDRNDLVQVIAFDSSYNVVVPLERNTDALRTAKIVRGISPGGGTNMYPPLRQAANDLMNAEANVKHVVLLTDGQSEGNANDGIQTAARMAAAGITVSTIAIGDGADRQTLFAIASAGGGKFHDVADPNLLPRILIKEIRVVRKPEVREAPFLPMDLRSGSPVTDGIGTPFLPLNGLVLTQPKPDAKIFNVLATPEGEPVLAHWFVGRGQAAAFTSDAHTWASEWIAGEDWGGYAKLWTQLVRSVSRPPMGRDYELDTRIVGDEMVVRIEAFDDDGSPVDNLTVPATVYAPDQSSVDITLEQIGPGIYEGRAAAPNQGSYVVAITPRLGARPMPPIVGGTTRQVGAEFRRLSSDVETLARIAEITGGRLLDIKDPDTAKLFDRSDLAPVRASSPLWPWLLAWSTVFFILDVATRRVAWDRLVNRHMAAELADHTVGAIRARGEGAVRTVGKLKARADRAAPPAQSAASPIGADTTSRPSPTRSTTPSAPPAPSTNAPTAAPAAGTPAPASPDEPAEGTTAGLLAAKRRARARLDDRSSDPPPQP